MTESTPNRRGHFLTTLPALEVRESLAPPTSNLCPSHRRVSAYPQALLNVPFAPACISIMRTRAQTRRCRSPPLSSYRVHRHPLDTLSDEGSRTEAARRGFAQQMHVSVLFQLDMVAPPSVKQSMSLHASSALLFLAVCPDLPNAQSRRQDITVHTSER